MSGYNHIIMRRFIVVLLALLFVFATAEEKVIKASSKINKKVAADIKKVNSALKKKKVTKKVTRKIIRIKKTIKRKITIHRKIVRRLKKRIVKLKKMKKTLRVRARKSINAELSRITWKLKQQRAKIAGYKVTLKSVKKNTAKLFIKGWGTFTLDITRGKKIQKKCMRKSIVRNIRRIVKKRDTKRLCAFIKEITIPEDCTKLELEMEKRLEKIKKWEIKIDNEIERVVKMYSSLKKYTMKVKVVAVKSIIYLRRIK